MAIDTAQRKRRELVNAHPASQHTAKIIAALPRAAEAYRRQIVKGLDDNPREANKARTILRDLLGPIQMCPEPDGSLWAEFYARPAALVKRAVGTSVGSDGSGGRMAFAASPLSWSRRLLTDAPRRASSACHDMGGEKTSRARVLFLFILLAPIGPLATYAGLTFLADSPQVIALIMIIRRWRYSLPDVPGNRTEGGA